MSGGGELAECAQSLGHLGASVGKVHLCFSETDQAQLGCSGSCCHRDAEKSPLRAWEALGVASPRRGLELRVEVPVQLDLVKHNTRWHMQRGCR